MNKKITARALALMLAAMMAVGTGSAFADSADTAADAAATAEVAAETTDAAETADAPAEAEATAKPEVAHNIVATVGDVQITAEETADLYSYVLEMYSYYGYDTTDSEIVAQLKDITLDAMVSAKAQEIMEAEMGLDQFTDEELAQFQSDAQATYDETYQSVYEGFDDGETSEDDLKAQTEAELNKYGYTVEALVEQAKAEAAYNKLYEALTKDVTVTDDDVKEEYAATVASDKEAYENDLDGYSLQSMYGERPAYTPEGIRTVKHILVKFTDEDSQKISELEALSEKPDDYDEQYQALIDAAYANIKDKVDEIMAKIDAGEDGYKGVVKPNVDASAREMLAYIHERKTARMIMAAFEAACELAGAGEDTRMKLMRFAEPFGLLFQVVDDYLDVCGDSAALGKHVGKDAESGKLTYITLYGVERTLMMRDDLKRQAGEALKSIPDSGFLACALEEMACRDR